MAGKAAFSMIFLGAFALGAISGLGFAPLHWGILAMAAYPCLYRLIFTETAETLTARKRAYRAAALVYLFYVGNYAVSLFWIGEAPQHYAADLWWMGLLAMVAVPLGLAVFFVPSAFAVGLMSGKKSQYPRILAMALALALAEYGRGHLFTGFAWNMPVHLLLGSAPLLQNVAWSGLYGGNLLLLTVLILPASLLYDGKRMYLGASVAVVLLTVAYGYGWYRLNAENPPTEAYGIRIVQSNIAGETRRLPEKIHDNFLKSLQLSRAKRPDWVKAVIWAEAVVPFDFTESSKWRAIAAQAAPEGGLMIAGATRYDRDRKVFYNSMLGVNAKRDKVLAYDKYHLVPFGEYVPLRGFVPLPAIASEGNEYAKGTPPKVIAIDDMPPFIPLICYEIIFPRWRNAAFAADNSARFILNLTNDEWYEPNFTGLPVGFYQHLQMARFAAVESGLPVVRAASTGISAVFDGRGRILEKIPYNTEGTLDTLLPPPEPSLALSWGEEIFVALFVTLSLACAVWILYISKR